MQTEQQKTIDNHVQQLGFTDVYAFALEQLILQNEEKHKENNAAIKDFEQKYKMDYFSFDESFHSINIDLFEKEDDGMEWEVRIAMQKELETILEELNSLKTIENDEA